MLFRSEGNIKAERKAECALDIEREREKRKGERQKEREVGERESSQAWGSGRSYDDAFSRSGDKVPRFKSQVRRGLRPDLQSCDPDTFPCSPEPHLSNISLSLFQGHTTSPHGQHDQPFPSTVNGESNPLKFYSPKNKRHSNLFQ